MNCVAPLRSIIIMHRASTDGAFRLSCNNPFFFAFTDPFISSQSCMISGVSNNSLNLSWTSASSCLPLTYYYTYNISTGMTVPYPTTSNQTRVTGLSSGSAYKFTVYAKLNGTNNQSNSINCSSSTGKLYN